MPDPPSIQRLRGLVLSATEVKNLTGWPSAMVEDYLNILDNIITLASLIDVEIDQKIEEIATDFTDGSIPFANAGHLDEDNAHLFWDLTNSILKITGIIQSTGRLKAGKVITNAMSPYTILRTDETLIGDTDTGVITMLLPAGVADTAFRITNSGISENDVTLTPDGADKIYGEAASLTIYDQEHFDIQYSSKGWI